MTAQDAAAGMSPSVGSDELLGYMLAEFRKSGRLRIAMFFIQLLAVLPGVLSIILLDPIQTYYLAIGGVLLLALWWVINTWYSRARKAAQTARRAVLLTNGLNYLLSPSAILSLKGKFTVNEDTARKSQRSDYYATPEPKGPKRLGEMLDESAFYSADLQGFSARTMQAIILLIVVVFAVVGFYGLPYSEASENIVFTRILLAAITFIVSSDVIGSYLAHKDAAASIEEIRTRLVEADARGYQEPDVLLALLDYSAAIEAAPEVVPFIYHARKGSLNSRWAGYLRDREHRRVISSQGIPSA